MLVRPYGTRTQQLTALIRWAVAPDRAWPRKRHKTSVELVPDQPSQCLRDPHAVLRARDPPRDAELVLDFGPRVIEASVCFGLRARHALVCVGDDSLNASIGSALVGCVSRLRGEFILPVSDCPAQPTAWVSLGRPGAPARPSRVCYPLQRQASFG